MLAPRFRASEQALALLVRAGRIAPTVMVQTFNPDHEVLRAAVSGNPNIVVDAERERRQMLGLPPYGALASVTGAFSGEVVGQLDREAVQVGGDGVDRYLVRARNWDTLGMAINATTRPPGSRVRVAVDPPRV
jgi:primosomal protein N' (replication factor Y)